MESGGTVVVIGGGPAGAFFAIHVLRKARELARDIKVIIIERQRQIRSSPPDCFTDNWNGCNYCAGGLSPKLNDVLDDLNLHLPEAVIQSRINSITIQGYWKNIELEVPPGRQMLSVYRGSRPMSRSERHHNFDSFLLDEALKAGAELIGGEANQVHYAPSGRLLVSYRANTTEAQLEADFVVFAAGVNKGPAIPGASSVLETLPQLIPGFVPPRLRRALIFELKSEPGIPASLTNAIHFVEYGSKTLRLEMCSLMPKRDFITVVLVGASIDAKAPREKSRDILRQFLELPHIRKLVSSGTRLRAACVCRANLVIGSAKRPFGDRIAVIGDLSTTRLYKDGILSAHQTARALAETVLMLGIDTCSLDQGYGPTLRNFRRDNRFASLVFFVHRIAFGSSVLSRVLYQAVITERKNRPSAQRHLEKILWQIASGDNQYEDIFFSLLHPRTLGSILAGGLLITLRNYLTELIFGLHWQGFGRFTTGVAKERFEAKRMAFSHLIAELNICLPQTWEFERMYTIKIQAPRAKIREQLGRFGEKERGYLRPRGIRIQRTAGIPHTPGCVIRYEVLCRHIAFNLVLEQTVGEHLEFYRVRDGFAQGGILLFEVEKLTEEISTLSIYVAFNFARGKNRITHPFWWLFRVFFPAFVHDVIWNHSLCQLKDIVETDRFSAADPGIGCMC